MFVLALFHGTRKLRRGQYRHVQLAGQGLKLTRDIRHLLNAVLGAEVATHQLQVIHQDQVQAVFGVETAGFGAHLQGRDGRGVVNEYLRVGKNAGGLHEGRPLILTQAAQAQALGINARLGGDQALHHLLGGHFQAEEGNTLIVFAGRVLGDGE